MRKKPWLVGLGITAAALAAAALFVRMALPPERLRGLVAAQLQTALGHPADIGAVHVGFAPLAVRVRDVRIGAPAGSESPHLLRVQSLELRPRLWPLLRRQIAVQRIRITGGELWLEQRADRTWNWTPPGTAPSGGTGPARGGSPLALQIDRLDLEAGRLHYRSAVTAVRASTPFAASIGVTADRNLRDVHISGWAAADTVWAAGKLGTARVGRIRVEPDVHVDVPDSSAKVERLRVWINDAPVDLAGTVRRSQGKPEFHLTTRSDGVDLAKLLAALPPGTPQTKGVQAAGTVRFDVRADAAAGALPVLHGFAELRDGTVQAAGLPDPITGLAARVDLSGDSLQLSELTARIGRAPVRVRGLVLDPALPQRTRYDLRIGAELDLAAVARAVPMAPGTTLAGHATVDLRVRGRTARPDSVFLEGPVELREAVFTTPLLRVPVRADARLQGAGTQLRIDTATVQAGTSRMTLRGALTPALPPRRPRLRLTGHSEAFDLAAVLPAAPAPTAATPAGTAAAPPLLPILPAADYELEITCGALKLEAAAIRDLHVQVTGGPAAAEVELRAAELRAEQVVLRTASGKLRVEGQRARGRLRAERAALQRIEVTALESDVEIRDATVLLPTMHGAAYGGTLQGKAAVDLTHPAAPRYDLETKAARLDANAFLGSVSPLRNVVAGVIDMESAWAFTGPEPAAVRKTLTGKGSAASLNGRIQELPLLDELAALLQLPSLRTLAYRDLGLHFAVDAGRMTLQDFALHAPDTEIGIGGSLGLDGTLDLALAVQLSGELSKRALSARGTGALTALFADPQGRLLFDVAVGGTAGAPRLRLDVDKTKTRAGVEALTEAAVQRVLGRLLGGRTTDTPGASTPGPAPTAPAPDATEAGRKALEEARKKLGGKLGGLLGGKARSDSVKKN